MEEFIKIVQQYVEKGERCMDMSENQPEYEFWDGFHNCAEKILRELKDLQT